MAERTTRTSGTMPARSTRRYRRHIFVHHGHGLALLAPVALFFLLGPWSAALAVVAIESLVVLVLPRIVFLRRAIDERLRERQRLRAALERTAMIARLSEPHRHELTELEQIAASLKMRMDLPSDGSDISGLDELAALYVRLALAHRCATDALARTGPAAPEEDLARALLPRALAEADGERDGGIRSSLALRVDILRMRCEARRSAQTHLRALEVDLAAIGDTIRWMSEYCATAGAEAARCTLASRFASARRNAETVRELCSLRTDQALGDFELTRDDAMLPEVVAS